MKICFTSILIGSNNG